MSVPRLCRQWEIYKANLGEPQDCWLLILSSTQTNDILQTTVLACEIIPEHVQRLTPSPLNIPSKPAETGLEWSAVLSVKTLASIPRGCLVSREGHLEPESLRFAALKALDIIVGTQRWPD